MKRIIALIVLTLTLIAAGIGAGAASAVSHNSPVIDPSTCVNTNRDHFIYYAGYVNAEPMNVYAFTSWTSSISLGSVWPTSSIICEYQAYEGKLDWVIL